MRIPCSVEKSGRQMVIRGIYQSKEDGNGEILDKMSRRLTGTILYLGLTRR